MKGIQTLFVMTTIYLLSFNIMATDYEVEWSALAEEQQNLVNAALEAMDKAYAPYSHYKVGAAIRGENNKIYCNCSPSI